MNFGKNLQYFRSLSRGMTQETLAERMGVSRQTVSKWEMDAAQPDMEKAIELCRVFGCTLDNLFREEMGACSAEYSDLRVETVPAFRYGKYAVISTDPEGDAIRHVRDVARRNGCEQPRVIGWDLPDLSSQQLHVYHMHGYVAAWVLPEGVTPGELEVCEQPAHRYAAIHIEKPFENPFVVIPGAYRTLVDYMRINGLGHSEKDVLPCFETDGETMDVYIACE